MKHFLFTFFQHFHTCTVFYESYYVKYTIYTKIIRDDVTSARLHALPPQLRLKEFR